MNLNLAVGIPFGVSLARKFSRSGIPKSLLSEPLNSMPFLANHKFDLTAPV